MSAVLLWMKEITSFIVLSVIEMEKRMVFDNQNRDELF